MDGAAVPLCQKGRIYIHHNALFFIQRAITCFVYEHVQVCNQETNTNSKMTDSEIHRHAENHADFEWNSSCLM